jgi:hypothetical protein
MKSRDIPMRQAHKIIVVIAVLFMVGGCYAQSLADVAREQRLKQAKAVPAAHKVITNEDIPESANSDSTSTSVIEEHDAAPATPASNDIHAGEEWKSKIEAQKNSIASLQSQLDHLNSSIHFAGPNCVANCEQYNEQQLKKQDEAERMQKQLDEQKQKLEDMQESARKAGLGSSVYEP